MTINKKREIVNIKPQSLDDECLMGIEIENLGSPTFSERTSLSIIASDANYLKFHKEHTPEYTGEISNPFYTENAKDFWLTLRGRYADIRQLTPFEILAAREAEELAEKDCSAS